MTVLAVRIGNQYTSATRKSAVALALAVNDDHAAQCTGVARSTVKKWRLRMAPRIKHVRTEPSSRPDFYCGALQRQIIAAIAMHGPMTVGQVWRAIVHDDPLYVGRAMHRLHKRGLLQRWGNPSHYTYAIPLCD